MKEKRRHILTATLIAVLMASALIAWAYFTATDSADNIFNFGNRYTLTYHANTGSDTSDADVTVPDVQTQYGDGADPVDFTVSSQKPTRPGFVFMGWYDKETPDTSSDTKYGPDDTTTYTAPTNQKESHLYAQWQAGYTLIYDANGGENAPDPKTVISDQGTHTFDNISNQGSMTYTMTVGGTDTTEAKVFLGWADSPDATKPKYTSDGKLAYNGTDFDGDTNDTFETTITLSSTQRTKTIYAVWATRYKLTFDANAKYNGTGNVPAEQTKVSTKTEWEFRIPANNSDNNDPAITPTRTDSSKGYRFGWWCDDPDSRDDGPGTYQYGEPVIVYDEAQKATHRDPWKVLYAIYKPPKTLGLRYDANGGNASSVPGVYWGSVLTERQLVDIDEATIPTRTNYIFMGWSKDKTRATNLERPENAAERQKNGDFNPGDQILIDIWEDSAPTLYAVWRAKHKFGVRFYLNGGSNVRYKNPSTGKWTYSSSYGWYESEWLNDENTIVDEYHGFNADFFKNNGIYATRNNDATASYKFLGWSFNKNNKPTASLTEEDVDIKVELPTDPFDPQTTATGTQGCITEEITVTEPNPGNCKTPVTHWRDLYAVWEKSPLHSYKIIFTNKDVPNNKNMEGVTIVNKAKNNATLNESESASTAAPIVSVQKGSGGEEIKSTSTIYGKKYEALSLSVTENPSKTWTTAELATSDMIPYATKAPTATERYVFKGWSYQPNSDTVDIAVDADGKITSSITVSDPNPTACEGEIHYLLLFPVFEPVPQHTYNLYLVPNFTTLSGYDKSLQYLYTNNNWYSLPMSYNTKDVTDIYGTPHAGTEGKGYTATLLTSKNQEVTETQWGDTDHKWLRASNNETILDKGVRISCNKNSSASASAPTYKFLGWSYNKNNKALDQLGSSDVDIYVDENGQWTSDVIIKESDVTDSSNKCSSAEGKVHNVVLYGVWEYEKAHQYTVVFSGVLDGARIMAKKTPTATTFDKMSTKTISKLTDYEGKEVKNIKVAWECDSPAEKLTDDTDAGYTWTSNEWADIGVYAEKDKDAKFKYHFKGWSTNPANKDPETLTESDVDVSMDAEGHLITTTVRIEDNDIANCQGNVKHYDVLYAVWDREAIPPTHTFSVKFNLNSGSYYKYYDDASGTWKTSSSSNYSTYTTDELEVASNPSYTFNKDYWKNTAKGLSATRNNSGTNSFDFVGWATKTDPSDPDYELYKLDDDGFLDADIKVECDKGSTCEDGKHVLNLYAIWDPKPLTKTYTLNFNLNTKSGEESQASGAPDTRTGSEVYGATTPNAWVNSYTFTLPNQKPTYKSMAFVGWSTNKNAMPGEYGYPNEDNPEIRDTTKDLIKNYVMTASGNSNASATLYAIWAYEYQMIYDANDGSSAPSMEHEYTNQTTHNYMLSENYPSRRGYKFLGWSEDPNATAPDYYPNSSDFGSDKPKVKTVTADPSGSTKIRLYAVWQAE